MYTTDSVREVALIRPGFGRATFPLGEGSANAVQICNVVPFYDTWYPTKPSPGGKVAAKQTNEGYVVKAVRSVLT